MPAELDSTLVANLTELAYTADIRYLQIRDGVGGAWSLPPKVETNWSGDLQDLVGLGKCFSQDDLYVAYRDVFLKGNLDSEDEEEAAERTTLGDMAFVKAQSGYLAQREMAFRVRHTTPIMAAHHAAARRRGHGQSEIPPKPDQDTSGAGLFSVVLNSMQDLMTLGR